MRGSAYVCDERAHEHPTRAVHLDVRARDRTATLAKNSDGRRTARGRTPLRAMCGNAGARCAPKREAYSEVATPRHLLGPNLI